MAERHTTLDDGTIVVEQWFETESGAYVYQLSEPVLGRLPVDVSIVQP